MEKKHTLTGEELLELPLLGKDEAWVQGILQSYNCRMQDVYLLTSEPGGKLYFAAMQEDPA